MKTYKINGHTISVHKGSIAHKIIERYIPHLVIGSVLLGIAVIYGLSILWAGILGGM